MFLAGMIALVVTLVVSPGEDSSGAPDFRSSDTLAQEISDGVILRLDGVKDTYTLDDTLRGVVVLANLASGGPLFLWTPSQARMTWTVGRLHISQPEHRDPTSVQPMTWQDTLEVGDSLCTRLEWRQETFNLVTPSSHELKAFSGTYRMRIEMWGNVLLQNRLLTKSFQITDEGEPLSSCVVQDRSDDSLSFDLVVRNRTSRFLEYPIVDTLPVKMHFQPRSDTALSLSYSVPFSTLRLSPHSDNVVFRLRLSRTDRMFERFKGQMLRLRCIFRLRDRELVLGRSLIYIRE
jgi:hypothetical protein